MKVIQQKRYYIDVDDFELTTLICALSLFKKDLTTHQAIQVQSFINELQSVHNN